MLHYFGWNYINPKRGKETSSELPDVTIRNLPLINEERYLLYKIFQNNVPGEKE